MSVRMYECVYECIVTLCICPRQRALTTLDYPHPHMHDRSQEPADL
jgi:hypothetical protein